MVDDDWLYFVGFIIYGFISTSAHFDSIPFDSIQSNPIRFHFVFSFELYWISSATCFCLFHWGTSWKWWSWLSSWWCWGFMMMDGWWKVGGLWCWDLCGSVVWIWPMIMGAHWSCVSMCKSEWVAVTRWVIVCAHIVSTWFAHFNGFWSFDTLFFVFFFFFAVADHLLVGAVGGVCRGHCCYLLQRVQLSNSLFNSVQFISAQFFLCRAAVVVFCVGLFLMVTCYGYLLLLLLFCFCNRRWLADCQTDRQTNWLPACTESI